MSCYVSVRRVTSFLAPMFTNSQTPITCVQISNPDFHPNGTEFGKYIQVLYYVQKKLGVSPLRFSQTNFYVHLVVPKFVNRHKMYKIQGRGSTDAVIWNVPCMAPISTKLSFIYSNIYPTRCNVTQFILSGQCSTCFGWYLHPSSGAQTTVSTTSGICQNVTAICRYSGR